MLKYKRHFIHFLTSDVTCNIGIIKDVLPNHVLYFVHIPSMIIRGKIISFHPNSPQGNPSQQKPKSRKLCSTRMEFVSQNSHVAS